MGDEHYCLICGADAYVGVGDARLRNAAGAVGTMWLCMDHFSAWLRERKEVLDKLKADLA